jgi:omega-6 fatty acid desaturase (delta-12 desaturase)
MERLTGKELILATRQFAKENRLKSWVLTLSTLVLLLAALAGTVWGFYLPGKILCSLVAGLLMVRMFVIYHDHQHRAILDKSAAAEVLFTLFGLYIMAPAGIWKRSHDYHHKHNSRLFSASIGSYPIMTRSKFASATPAQRREYLFARHPLTIFSGYYTMFIWGMCVGSFRSNPARHIDSLVALVLHVAAYALIGYFGGMEILLLSWIIPFTIACGIGSYLFYAQHNFPGVTFRENIEWSYEHAALESSSFMKMSPVMNWFTGNIGYHHIHHINARIPFYRLPEVMSSIPELQKAKTTSMKPREIARCLRLKVWDPQRNEMVGLTEVET